MIYDDRLEDLQRRAIILSSRSSPWTAQVLQVYPYLTSDDIRVIQAGRDLQPDRLAELASASRVPDHDILYIAHEQVRLDFNEYEGYYHTLLISYQQAAMNEGKLNAFVTDPVHGGRLFLFYGTLHVWDDFSGELSSLIVEPDSDEDVTPDAIEGYLVSKGLAFPTSVDLLEACFQQEWPEWQSLWRQL